MLSENATCGIFGDLEHIRNSIDLMCRLKNAFYLQSKLKLLVSPIKHTSKYMTAASLQSDSHED